METNLQRWQYYMKDISSPESFINWGFYGAIACTLQRKVFTGTLRSPLFANMYIIPTGPPGVGKGLVLKEVSKLLRYHKFDAKSQDLMFKKSEPKFDDKSYMNIMKGEGDLLIQVGPDATTYQALTTAMSNSIRSLYYQENENQKKLYVHSSICFVLEEMSSLFRKHVEDLVNFLLAAYDCGSYVYETISRGKDVIRNGCLNLIAGTTPGFIKSIFGDELITEGFASRAIFVCENFPRFYRHKPPEFSEDQIAGYNVILDHLKVLGDPKFFGEVKFSPEADAFLNDWWKTTAQTKRVNNSPKLIPYYARKNITVLKLAMILHFADNTTFEIGLDKCIKAIEILDQTELLMHNALTVEGKNALAAPSETVMRIISDKPNLTKSDLLFEAWEILPEGEKSLDSIIGYLTKIGKIKSVGGKYDLANRVETLDKSNIIKML
jgi:hypothetical protein